MSTDEKNTNDKKEEPLCKTCGKPGWEGGPINYEGECPLCQEITDVERWVNERR